MSESQQPSVKPPSVMKCVSTDPLKIGAASAVLVGGAMLIQGDGMKGAAKSAGIQFVSSTATHLIADYVVAQAAVEVASGKAKADDWRLQGRDWSGLALEAVAVGGLFAAAERWGRGSCCPLKDFLTSSIADFAAGAVIVKGMSEPTDMVCYIRA